MPDVRDLATEREEQLREDALQAAKRARDAVRSQPSALVCDRCADAIPEARQKAVPGCRHCMPCQQIVERMQ